MSKFAHLKDAGGLILVDVTRIVAVYHGTHEEDGECTTIQTDAQDGDENITIFVQNSVMEVHAEIERCLRTMKPEL